MGCGCGRKRNNAVTSVNEAELALQREEEQAALIRDMESLRAAVYNSQSDVVAEEPVK